MSVIRRFSLWKHEDCFPIIRDAIIELCRRKGGGLVLHDEIVDALLGNLFIVSRIAKIRAEKDQEKHEIAGNMVDWFSKGITEYENGNLSPDYVQFNVIEEAYQMLARERIEGKYAYTLQIGPKALSKIVQKYEEDRRRKEEYRKFVEELKRLRLPAEEYRRRDAEWRKQHRS